MVESDTDTPFISIPGVLNFRDIGGYPIPSRPGKQVRRGLVYRSAEPSEVTDAGLDKIQRLGIAISYDLRSERELARANQDFKLFRDGYTGIKKILAPVFRDEDYSPEAIALRFKTYRASPEGFAEGYFAVLTAGAHPENGARPYATILEHLTTDTAPQPILIHCQVGKDRTGIICALILSLCGVEDDVVADEYSLSDIGLASLHEQLVANLLLKAEFREDPESARLMVLTRRDNMLLFLKKIKKEHGSVKQCVINLNLLTEEGIEQLRTNMIVDITN
ncbi:tyrosine phosphatase [Xylaria bambusicola]|uniref:tyrosine phosphatase n=1 Tax=Xylaria bambusicola TaxID=326684 RepID=UPI0020072F2B|nr:tyrosine phosphatase [Xylaria bambusicola]KAI0506609.1 tyrosine phosphatase [Xylaria bambusicola]